MSRVLFHPQRHLADGYHVATVLGNSLLVRDSKEHGAPDRRASYLVSRTSTLASYNLYYHFEHFEANSCCQRRLSLAMATEILNLTR